LGNSLKLNGKQREKQRKPEQKKGRVNNKTNKTMFNASRKEKLVYILKNAQKMQRKNCTIFYTPWHASREQSVLLEIRRRSSGQKQNRKRYKKVAGRGSSKGFFSASRLLGEMERAEGLGTDGDGVELAETVVGPKFCPVKVQAEGFGFGGHDGVGGPLPLKRIVADELLESKKGLLLANHWKWVLRQKT